MDFNKEEAARARNIAEEKLWNNDFGTARRIALRAKKLDSQLENLNQILSVCDVHCAAENKINGKEMDWYGILQLEKRGDESLIKKQYRKLALLLHPDKNQYPGAEAAFKLIGEAQKVLLDQPKHQLHDSVRANSASATGHPACRQAEKPSTDKNPPVPNNRTNPFATKHVKKNPPPCQQHAKLKTNTKSGGRISFWTECTVCSYKNDFIVGKLGVPFMCQSCNKTFIPRSMSIGTKSCSEPTTPDMLKYADPATWYEKFGLDEMKIKGFRKRKAGACKSSGKDAKKQCKTSNMSSSQAEAKYC